MNILYSSLLPIRCPDGEASASPPVPFGKACSKEVEGIKESFAGRGNVDAQVREQINADLGKMKDRYDRMKY